MLVCLFLCFCFQVKYHQIGPILEAETDIFDLHRKCYHLSVVFVSQPIIKSLKTSDLLANRNISILL